MKNQERPSLPMYAISPPTPITPIDDLDRASEKLIRAMQLLDGRGHTPAVSYINDAAQLIISAKRKIKRALDISTNE